MNTTNVFFLLVFCALVGFLWFLYRKNFKLLRSPSVCLVTGGVKCGKSLCCVYLSTKEYKRVHRKWWFAAKVLKKEIEEPLFYTNVSISFGSLRSKKPHRLDKNIVLINTHHLLREVRFNYKSVIYIQEASLFADNMDFNNKDRNCELTLFNKLIAHETRGGCIFYDTQSVLDLHYSIKRCSSTYYFIQKNANFLLFHILYIREMINTENGVNNFTDDVDESTRKVLIPFWYHHRYDRYEYSYLTDNLGYQNACFEKHPGVISFNPLTMKKARK